MADESNNPIKSAIDSEKAKLLDELFADAEARKAYVKHMTKGRPKSWKRTSNATYYKEPYGLWMKMIADEMIKDHLSREIMYHDFPDLSRTSLYLRVNQSKMYLLQELDYDGAYKRFFEFVHISKSPTGIRLKYCEGGADITPMPARVISFNTVTSVMDSIDRFLNDHKENQTEFKNITFSEEDMTAIHNSLANLDHIAYNLTPTSLKIVKLS
jgi:hypothetical protein